MTVMAVLISVVFAGCFLTDPKTEKNDPTDPTTLPTQPMINVTGGMVAGSAEWAERINEYYNLDASNGLDVYVWQMAQRIYSFGVLPHSEQPREPLDEELLKMPGVSYDIMAHILWSYDIAEEDIHIIPWQNPISSYIPEYWVYTEGETEAEHTAKQAKYIETIRYLLLDYLYETPVQPIDQIVVDIDGDGRVEECYLADGITYGVSSFRFYTRELGQKKWEYMSLVAPIHWYSEMKFVVDSEGKVWIDAVCLGFGTEDELQRLEIKLMEGYVDFLHNGETILRGLSPDE